MTSSSERNSRELRFKELKLGAGRSRLGAIQLKMLDSSAKTEIGFVSQNLVSSYKMGHVFLCYLQPSLGFYITDRLQVLVFSLLF